MIKQLYIPTESSGKNFLILLCLLVLLVINGYAQAPSTNENFVRTEVVKVPAITTDAGVLSLTSDQKATSYHYMDGLGRSLQTVAVQGSPQKKDIVQPAYYDPQGKPTRSYLPYTATTTTGAIRSSALTEQGTYYTTPPAGVPTDSKAYGTTLFEASPLNRPVSGTMVGNDFQSKQSTNKLMVNEAGVVRMWTISNGLPKSTSTYPAGALALQESIDEAGSTVRTYTDMGGKTILNQTKLNTSTWLNTYYVYNDFNELVIVIPPSASSTYTPDQTFANLWYTQYEYDNLGRQTGFKFPGVDWSYTIFDRWDRPVLVQDAIQRAKPTPEWTFFKYDGLNRMVISGTFASTSTRAALTTAVANATTRDEQATTANSIGYTLNRTYPTTVTDANIISVLYYDNYNFLSLTGWTVSNSLYNYVAESGFAGTRSTNVKGLLTGSKSRTQGTNTTWLNSVTYYDKYYQPLQTISGHQQGGTLKTVTQYSFVGNVEKTLNIYSYSGGTTRVQRRYTYDHAGRPLRVYHKLNALAEVMLSEITYNELGQPYKSRHHSRNNGSTWLFQTVSDYAIQGWMKKKQYQFSDGTNIFTQELGYHNALGTGNSVRFDGMITANKWKHHGNAPEKAYNYSYDSPKRLTQSTYTQKNNGATSWTANNFFAESNIAYDANGNITAMLRNQEKASAAAQMDNLAYTYSGNMLTAVTDNAPAANKAAGFNDGNSTGADYTYNENGNLTADKNKGITSIVYNQMNLPERINFASGANIRYTYSASRGLLTISYHNTPTGAPTKTIQYVGELVFENNVLTDVNHEYGRVLANAGNKYQYKLTDHLGSTRVVVQEDPANFTVSASFEPEAFTEESEQFLDYEQTTRLAAKIFDHTNSGDSKYALRLGGGPEETMGPAKSLSLMPGDTVRMEVYGKYLDLKDPKLDPAFVALALSFTGSPVMSMDGGAVNLSGQGSSIQQSFAGLLGTDKGAADAPPAYLNYHFFDREMNYKDGGFVQMTEAAREDGSNVSHEKLSAEFIAEEPGYLYIYLSNEGRAGSGEAYFDDFDITTSESYIVQTIDYYPYGLVANNWQREGEKATKELFQGKTYEELTQWSDFHARQYDAAVVRWFGVDPAGQFASPYVGMGNNPVMMVDPDGEFAFVPVAIGAVIGAYMGGTMANEGQMNPGKWDYSSGRTWGYMAAGALVGGISGGAANAVATSGMPFANTAAIMTGSYINSVGTAVYTGGQTDVSISFGVASYNFDQNEWGYLGKRGNSALENIGYGLGALANLNDVNNLIDATKASLYTQERYSDGSKDIISHTGIVDDASGETLMSFGPNDNKIGGGGFKDKMGTKPGGGYKKFGLAVRKGTSDYPVPIDLSRSTSITANKYLFRGLKGFSSIVPYQGATTNCVNMSSLGLWLNGIPNIGIHPYLLHYSMAAYNSGVRPDLFSYYFQRSR